eukprot:9471727-Pyramimonas_sp.AAC.1
MATAQPVRGARLTQYAKCLKLHRVGSDATSVHCPTEHASTSTHHAHQTCLWHSSPTTLPSPLGDDRIVSVWDMSPASPEPALRCIGTHNGHVAVMFQSVVISVGDGVLVERNAIIACI